jgi:hypothetical protein
MPNKKTKLDIVALQERIISETSNLPADIVLELYDIDVYEIAADLVLNWSMSEEELLDFLTKIRRIAKKYVKSLN